MKRMVVCACFCLLQIGLFANEESCNGALWQFDVREGSATLRKCQVETVGVLRIPDTLGGNPVVEIASRAFLGTTNITTIIIPASVTNLQPIAFAYEMVRRIPGYGHIDCTYQYSKIDTMNYLFLGPPPSINRSYIREGEPYYTDYGYGNWYTNMDREFNDRNVYYVEGVDGWVNGEPPGGNGWYYWGGVRKCGAVAVEIDYNDETHEVCMKCVNSSATIFYTIDGDEPTTSETERCFRYTQPIKLSHKTTVKALAYVPSYPYTLTAEKSFALGVVEKPVITASDMKFEGASTDVSISCPTKDATVLYTLDGSDPSATNGTVYVGPFSICESTTVKAIGVKEDWNDSSVVTVKFLKAKNNNGRLMISAEPQHPWNGLVDVVLTMHGAADDLSQAVCHFTATNGMSNAAIPVEHITRNGSDSCSGSTWTRRYVWDAATDAGAVKIDDVVLTVDVEIPLSGVQLWANGPYWSECNVGATKPEEYGYFFSWGDTVGYKKEGENWKADDGSIVGFTFSPENCPIYGMGDSALRDAGYIDLAGNLVASHDAATANFGAPWRMPTHTEFEELISNCDREWTTRDGVCGWLLKGKESPYRSRSIFLPASGGGYGPSWYNATLDGYYWSSTLSRNAGNAYYLNFNSSLFSIASLTFYDGRSVRPLRGHDDVSTVAVHGVTTHFALCPLEIKSVVAKQRYPWNGLVDVSVTFQGVSNDVVMLECRFVATNKANNVAIPVTHITCNGDDSGSMTTWTRRFIWDAAADVGAVKIDAAVLTVVAEIPHGGVRLWENGPYWAECNVGATKPEEIGYYFWWGDTVGYKRNANNDGWVSVKDSSVYSFSRGNCPTVGKDNSELLSEGYIDAKGCIEAAHDAATAYRGAFWRMPTDAETAALISNCTTLWTTRNGVNGRLVTGKGAYSSKSIFLPTTGFGSDTYIYNLGSYGGYWSSTPNSSNVSEAWNLYFFSDVFSRGADGDRNCGQSVRPVREIALAMGESHEFWLDCRTGGREALMTEPIRYSSAWESDDIGAMAEVSVNGALLKSASGEGSVDWTPTRGGTYTLTHVVKVGDAQAGETLEAQFIVPDLAGEAILTGRVAIVDGKYVAGVSGSDVDCEYTVRYALSPEGPFVDELGASDGEIASEFWYVLSGDGYLPVTNRATVGEITAGAFYGRQDLTRVVIPVTVTNIGHHAFACCSNLVSVTMGDSVAAVGRYAFAGCPKTVDFDLPSGVSVENLPKDGLQNQVTAVAAAAHPAWTEDVWDGYMDIDYTVAGAAISGVAAVTVKIVATDGVTAYPVTTVKGDVSASAGAHHLVWDAVADLGESSPKNLSVRVTLEPKDGSDEVIAPLEGDYAADLSLVSFRTTFGSRTSHAATIDFAKAVPLRYEVASDGSAVIVEGAYTADGRILLPEALDGHAISGIRDGAFPTIAGGATFVLPDSTTAFDTATAVKWAGLKGVTTSIVFPTGVTAFQVAAFRQFQNLTRVVFNGKPDALSDSLLAYLKTSGLEIVYPEEFAAEWEAALARYVTAGVIVLSAAPRTDDPTVMDVTYRIGGTVNPVRARTLAFKDNVRSFANVVRPETFAEGTEAELGEGMAPDVVHKFSWKVAADWQINLAKVRMEVLILPDDLLPLKFFTIPANGGHSAITVSRNALTEQRVLDALLWLYADGDRDLTLVDGVLRCGETVLASGSVPNGEQAVAYVFSKMGCRILTDEELKYVNEVSRLGLKPEGVRQYAVKIEGE